MDHYTRSAQNCFAGHPIDRVSHLRKDAVWLAEQLADPNTRFVPVWQSMSLVTTAPDLHAVFLSAQDLDDIIQRATSTVLLGQAKSRAYFAIELQKDSAAPPSLMRLGQFQDLRYVGALLNHWEGALLAYARAMFYWHHRHRFCGDCGSPTKSIWGGHLRICTNPGCGQQHFPRTDPAIIVLVAASERCLLGRQAMWPPGRYSVIAGFVEPGESLEDAVIREVLEETGIHVKTIHYHSSQPWPFPSSIMLGFTAQAEDEAIQRKDGELEDARWLSRQEIVTALQGGDFSLPSPVSISYRLIEGWFNAGEMGRLSDIQQKIHHGDTENTEGTRRKI